MHKDRCGGETALMIVSATSQLNVTGQQREDCEIALF